ncbi:uncharacterized protein LOC123291465 [Chrysoperla carnea]|uniref:uncharacterized protein LOC123291465 n=1 Tax=Chrysoperla carnea TaxID=189513 RepID=UPI001D06C90D|nr:uncharacterized protein LOC123291465 [Chrysoperla carnea]
MEENNSISTSTYTDLSHLSSNVENVIKQKRTNEDEIRKLDTVLDLLAAVNRNQDPESKVTHENYNEYKQIYYSQLTKQVKANEIQTPNAFMQILKACEQALRQKNEIYSSLNKILQAKRDKMENESNSLEKRIEIMEQIKLKILAQHKQKVDLNRTKVENEIDTKIAECKQDLKDVMQKFYPGDVNITSLLQQLFTAHRKGGSAGYIKIDHADSPLIFMLKREKIIESNPINSMEIKFTIFS